MKNFFIQQNSTLSRDVLFRISTDIANFDKILPSYFKSLKIIEENKSEKIVQEIIRFLGKTSSVKTKHIVEFPNTHKVIILDGMLKGTVFSELYETSENGASVKISVHLKLNGIIKFIPLLDLFIFKKMKSVTKEFIISSENFVQNSDHTK